MKSDLRSNPFFLWGWLSFFLIFPLISFYLVMGEINLGKQNWIIASNQATSGIFLPVSESNLTTEWNNWVKTAIPNDYHEYFFNLQKTFEVKQWYTNNVLTINGIIQPFAIEFYFNYPFTKINLNVIWVFFSVLVFNLFLLKIYHIATKRFSKRQYLSNEAYAFLLGFWLAIVVLYFSGGIPWFGQNHPNKVLWYIITIRVLLILLSGFLGFYLPFKIHVWYQRKFNTLYYLEGIKELKKEEEIYQKKRVFNNKKRDQRISIKLGK